LPVPVLSPRLAAAVADRTSGASGVARQVIDGLLEFAGEPALLRSTAERLPGLFPGYASMWHIAHAARTHDPAGALRAIRDQLDFAVGRSVAVAIKLVLDRGVGVRTAPSSALVKAVVAALPPGRADNPAWTGPTIGLAGADAISPTTVLNIRGTLALARDVPTIVVTTALKLVPEHVFARLGSPLFERVPLASFEAVVLDGDLLSPDEAAQRAALVQGKFG
jgi:hypothetical protein